MSQNPHASINEPSTSESETILISRYKSIVKHKRINSATFASGLRRYFNEYASITVIHGVRLLAEHRSLCEKIAWSLMTLAALGFGIYAIVVLYGVYETAPIIVAYNPKPVPIYDIPFPAVSICSEVKMARKYLNFTKSFLQYKSLDPNMSAEERLHYEYFYLMCDHRRDSGLNTTKLIDNSTHLFEIYDKYQSPFDEWVLHCFSAKRELNCSQLFKPIVVDEGICYSYNMIDRGSIFKDNVKWHDTFYKAASAENHWRNYYGYDTPKVNTYPRRGSLAGIEHGLQIVLKQQRSDLDYKCKSGMQGFRVVLHRPTELPRFRKRHFRVGIRKQTVVAVLPTFMDISPEVRSYSAKYRRCYTADERPLMYFKIYSQNNCLLECEANYTRKTCGCVPFFMPRHADTKICSAGSWMCYIEKTTAWEREVASETLGADDTINRGGSCNCLPLCNDLEYLFGHSVTHWNWRNVKSENFGHPCIKSDAGSSFCNRLDYNVATCNDTSQCELALLTIYFSEGSFLKKERKELLGMTELFAKLGGLLNFFLGISIMTFVEIFYFLTIRIICNKRMFGHWWETR